MIQNLFVKRRLSNKLPMSLRVKVDEVAATKSKEDAIKLAYRIVTDKYYGSRIKTYLALKKLFTTDVNKIWQTDGFYQCTTQNYLIRLSLVKSGKFKESEIKQRLTVIWGFSPHQYLRVCISENEYINIDAWAKIFGIKYGDYTRWFH